MYHHEQQRTHHRRLRSSSLRRSILHHHLPLLHPSTWRPRVQTWTGLLLHLHLHWDSRGSAQPEGRQLRQQPHESHLQSLLCSQRRQPTVQASQRERRCHPPASPPTPCLQRQHHCLAYCRVAGVASTSTASPLAGGLTDPSIPVWSPQACVQQHDECRSERPALALLPLQPSACDDESLGDDECLDSLLVASAVPEGWITREAGWKGGRDVGRLGDRRGRERARDSEGRSCLAPCSRSGNRCRRRLPHRLWTGSREATLCSRETQGDGDPLLSSDPRVRASVRVPDVPPTSASCPAKGRPASASATLA